MNTRIGFIGAGGIADRHISNLLTFSDVTVVAVADPRRDRAEAAWRARLRRSRRDARV
jgi:predicted dehydrogenase